MLGRRNSTCKDTEARKSRVTLTSTNGLCDWSPGVHHCALSMVAAKWTARERGGT
jgi:hypothetical protein